MTLEIKAVKSANDIQQVDQLAEAIWTEHFTPIIGKEQVAYMLKKFQCAQAIEKQIKAKYEYYISFQNDEAKGYIALMPNTPTGKMMLSKIYLKKDSRGSGIGNKLLDFAKDRAAKSNAKSLWLTVNKENTNTINWYKKRGFEITEAAKKEIGNGFYMDDYIMELELC